MVLIEQWEGRLKETFKGSQSLRLAGVALLFPVLVNLSLAYFSPDGVIGVLWPPAGLALAILILGGRKYGWAVLVGYFVAELWSGLPVVASALISVGAVSGSIIGRELLLADHRFDSRMASLGDLWRLMLKAAIPAGVVSASIGVPTLTFAKILAAENIYANFVFWAMGDALGIFLVTQLILILRGKTPTPSHTAKWPEILLISVCTLATAQVVFVGNVPDVLPQFPRKGYWLFPFLGWAATRMGRQGTIALLCLTSMQAMRGIDRNAAFFASEQIEIRLLDGWSFITVMTGWAMALAIYFQERRASEAELQVAATAFECQEGMIITDAKGLIVRTNQSFSRIMGYSNDEVTGKTTAFMHPVDQQGVFYAGAIEPGSREGRWASEVLHIRKSGEQFPQWLTCTAVKNGKGEVTNYVITHMDITSQKAEEARRMADEALHRDALVREVHHRIKNSLQGISGMLRRYAQTRPELEVLISEVVSQVRSIASLHGLQGRTSVETVRLCELTTAIAADLQGVWETPINVHIPQAWTPAIVVDNESVPLALVLNELLVNAIKHGGKSAGGVDVQLRRHASHAGIQVCISNRGRMASDLTHSRETTSGLQLISSLMPRHGASLYWEQVDDTVLARLELEPPVIHMETVVQNEHKN